MTDQNGQVTTYTYTDTGRLASITAPGSKVWNFSYNSLGQKTQYIHPNNTKTEYGYDARHRLTSITHKDNANQTVLDSFTFTLDNEGNISQVTHADGTKWVYTYDNRDRLTAGNLRDSGSNNLRTYGYTYDAAGNLTAKTRTVTSPASSDSWAYTYNNANEQLTFTKSGGTTMSNTFDAWGRLATRTQGSSYATYNYRYGGKLYSTTTNFAGETAETMQYRGDGRLYSRAWGSTTKVYRYDRGWNAINEENGAGTLQYTNVYGPGGGVGARMAWVAGSMSSGTWNYAYHDQLGSTRRWRNASKALTATDDFGPYGEGITTSTATPYDYALHEFDSNTAGYRSAYRLYSSGFARWTTRDPLGMVDGTNMYAYVGGNSIRFMDPDGLDKRDGLDTKIANLLACMEAFMGQHIEVISGERPGDTGGPHENGDAIDIKKDPGKDPGKSWACEAKMAAQECAALSGYTGLRTCQNTNYGHLHVDLLDGTKAPNGKKRSADCSLWGEYCDPCK